MRRYPAISSSIQRSPVREIQAIAGWVSPEAQAALQALNEWAEQFPKRKPSHYLFPSERYGLIGTKHVYGGAASCPTA